MLREANFGATEGRQGKVADLEGNTSSRTRGVKLMCDFESGTHRCGGLYYYAPQFMPSEARHLQWPYEGMPEEKQAEFAGT